MVLKPIQEGQSKFSQVKNRDQDFRGDRPRRMGDAERVTLTRTVLVGHPDAV